MPYILGLFTGRKHVCGILRECIFLNEDWNWVRLSKKTAEIQTYFLNRWTIEIVLGVLRFGLTEGIPSQDYILTTIIREFCHLN